MISVSNVTMRYGAKVLFDEVSTGFTPGKRYGLTGPNGAGKSTFMNLLNGTLDPQKGTVTRPKKLGVLSQDQFAFDRFRVLDTVVMGNKRLWAAMEERDLIYAKPEMTDADGMRLGELEGLVGEEDGYSAESDAAILLEGLDIQGAVHERKMGELQGGQKVRVLLAQALFGHPQALLLDEPTNHLDLESIHWLQGFLNQYDGVVIVISHDRHFLNRVCTHIADIDYETIITYTGSYDDMVVTKTQIRAQIGAQNAQREKKIAQLNDFIARFSAGTRSSQVQSRRKEVERLQVTELARSNIQRPYLKFEPKRPSGKHVLEVEGVGQSYGATEVIRSFTASIGRGEKIALLGRNGAGKTTLLNALLANSPTLSVAELQQTSGYEGPFLTGGKVVWGHEAAVGYFAQDHKALDPARDDRVRMAQAVGSHGFQRGAPRPARTDALSPRGCRQAHRGAFRRRGRAPALLQADAAEAERSRARRADQPPRSRVDQRAQHRTPALSGHRAPGHPRRRPDRRGGHAYLALRGKPPDHGLQGRLRGVPVDFGLTHRK